MVLCEVVFWGLIILVRTMPKPNPLKKGERKMNQGPSQIGPAFNPGQGGTYGGRSKYISSLAYDSDYSGYSLLTGGK